MIPSDHLEADNKRSSVVQILDQIQVLLVTSAPTSKDGLFLSQALVPVPPNEANRYFVKLNHGYSTDLEQGNFSRNQIIFLCNIAQISPAAATHLHAFVKSGGTLAIFPGSQTIPEAYNKALEDILPARLGARAVPDNADGILNWQSKGYTHPITELWNLPDSGNLGSVRVFNYFPLTLNTGISPEDQPKIVIRYSDGEPAVVEQGSGKGEVFLFSTSALMEDTTLPFHHGFVPLLIRMISYSQGHAGGDRDLLAGTPFVYHVDFADIGQSVTVLPPGQTTRQEAGIVEQDEHGGVLRYSATEKSGVYQVFIGKDLFPRMAFAVQVAPSESDLTQISESRIKPLESTSTPEKTTGETNRPDKAAAVLVPGPEIWFELTCAVFLIFLTETAVAHFLSRYR